MQGGRVICFWKALDEGFPKMYDMPPFVASSSSFSTLLGLQFKKAN
jgi:hypothetical protein